MGYKNVVPVDYVLKFDEDFYNVITDGVKVSTIRGESKPIDIGDYVFAIFPPSKDKVKLLKICGHYAIKFKDISCDEAKMEGYFHVDLLKHELKSFYSDIVDDDYVYVYCFEVITNQNVLVNEFRNDLKKES